MSHRKFQTRAMVLRLSPYREADKIVTLYTRDFGLIKARVRSVRELRSKMRAHLQYLNLIDVNLIQGREFWNLAGTHEHLSSTQVLTGPDEGQCFGLLEKASALLLRLCQGEEPNLELWREIVTVYERVLDRTSDEIFAQVSEYGEGHVDSSLGIAGVDQVGSAPMQPSTPWDLIEVVLVTRILATLGYGELPNVLKNVNNLYQSDFLENHRASIKKLIPQINQALNDSQL